MTKTAWVFPGQGSQAIGMGASLIDQPEAKAKFQQAESILGWSVLEVCQTEELNRTLYTQPCLYTIAAILSDRLPTRPHVVAGHSLGEFVALYSAGVFDFSTGLQLVKYRAELMDQARGGKMVALLGGDLAAIKNAIANQTDVVLANDNCPGQVVISGTPEAVDSLIAQIKVKRAMPLNVSGAFHSPLMAQAAAQFSQTLAEVDFNDAQVPVLSNVDPQPTRDAAILKHRLDQQMTGPVRWTEIVQQLPKLGVRQVVEVGPGKVLMGLIKRTCEDLELMHVDNII